MTLEDITPLMNLSEHTGKNNSSGSTSVPLVVGLSVGVPLAVLAITAAVVVVVVWTRRRSTGKFKSMEPRADMPKSIQDYPPVSASSYPPAPAPTEHIYENYQTGGGSPHPGSRPPVTASRGQRNDHSPRRGEPADTGIYANIPATFPSRS